MKTKTPPRLDSLQWFVAIAAGLAIFLLPQDAQAYFVDGYRQVYVAALTFGISLVLLFLFKLYEPIGIAMLSAMILTILEFAIRIGERIYDPEIESFTMALNVYDGLSWGLVWFMPLLCCFLMRLFAQEKWSETEAKLDFCRFFQKAAIASALYLLILLMAVFIYLRPANLGGLRQLNLMPFGQITQYIETFRQGDPGGMKLLISDVLYFIPIGFFLFALAPSWKMWKKIAAALILSLVIEGVQYALNTGAAALDDVLCSMVGFAAGGFVKFSFDKIRSSVTKGREPKICYVRSQLSH